MNTSDERDPVGPDDVGQHEGTHSREPGGPYFGRLLIVLLLAVAFCGLMTWYLSSVMTS